ncbi:hypothetical protein KIW84_043453 [Lathyrus oleraceus]|uniref:Uncharacterized protein n=1 Tax=Pisum sativum TaxID=3888 RepID=A0A9D5AUQ6_PEA|nr:hypothetical protein KIW84_043453 [Pisum sativum]
MVKTAFAEVCSRYLSAWQYVVMAMAFRINRQNMVETCTNEASIKGKVLMKCCSLYRPAAIHITMHKPAINQQPVPDTMQDVKQVRIHNMLSQNLTTVSSQLPMILLHHEPNFLSYCTRCETKVPSSGNYHQQAATRNGDQTHATCDSHKTEWDDNLALKGHEVHENDSELSAQDKGVNSVKVGADVVEDVSLRISNSERVIAHDLASKPDVSRTHVMRTREGQEADELDKAKSCRRTDAIIDDQKDIPLFEANEGDQSLSGITTENTTIKEASHEAEQLDRPVELFSSLDIVSDKHSGSDKGQ